MKVRPFLICALLPLFAVSCKSTGSSDSAYEDPYGSSDGSYNPYPDATYDGGSSDASYTAAGSSTPNYDRPPEDSSYAFDSSSSTSASSSSSAADTSYTPPAKPKSTSSSVKKKAVVSKPKAKKSTAVVARRSHTVTRGDTLYSLARRYGTTVTKIRAANDITGDVIRTGQRLKIP